MAKENKLKKICATINYNKKNESKYYMFGLDYFGPFLYGYVLWLKVAIKSSDCKKVFFFSRDGYMMEKAFSLIYDAQDMEINYVYFSRKSIRQAMLHTLTSYEESLKFLTWERYITVAKLLEYYGFSEKERIEISEKYNLQLEEDLDYAGLKANKQIKKLYYAIKSDIDKNSIQQDELLYKYIYQIGLTEKVAIVDIGWHGSMQYYLEEYCRSKNIPIDTYGFYVGINPNKQIKGRTYGYIYDKDDLSMCKDILCFFGGYEKLFQSAEGSTYGYDLKNDKVVPRLAEYEYINEPEFVEAIAKWQDAALFFVKEANRNNYQLDNIREWAYPLIRFGKKPTYRDTRLFRDFYNTDGTRIYYVSQKPIYKYSFKEMIHALSNSAWKTGFMKSVFRIPFPYYKIYNILKK